MSMNLEVKSAGRILELLEFLAAAAEPVSLKEVALELGFPRSSTHGLLQTLVGRGYALREEGDRYVMNPACRSGPGWSGGPTAHLVAVARPVMEKLRDESGETVVLGVRMRNQDVKRCAKLVSLQAVRYDTTRETQMPAYCTAMGRVLLAYAEPGVVDAYLARLQPERLTPRTVTDRAALRGLIEAARRDGYAISDEEMVLGGTGIAAPVRTRSGRVEAAINLGVVTPRYAANRERMIGLVVAAARQLSFRMGHMSAVESAAA
ncbi:IclR family transcriptional regulator [Teichococcus aestuarii]|uniref:Transcriptional regulator n=2 Tax=Teichococcus aestuarii TaxID=568898 RepID=A0A2U1V9W0_9PROT|nr:IclR family transcriptional regulator [Pseudoroseomonas aestuarii]PWC30674.1 transcriptional regulator [Pseudoroseomonas aestuarii]